MNAKLDWNTEFSADLADDAFPAVEISDGYMTYTAAIPASMTLDRAIDDYAATADYSQASEDVTCTAKLWTERPTRGEHGGYIEQPADEQDFTIQAASNERAEG